MKILHVVRRYGPVGGMERYVWELTRELQQLGHDIEVLCEVCTEPKPAGITVHELGTMASRPRWLALLRFSGRVTGWLRDHPHPGWVIHSHERLGVHHVTTFHGPPFATVRALPWWRRISVRVAMQLFLERRELERAWHIVPNSRVIRDLLAQYYPYLSNKLTAPAVPGVAPPPVRPPRSVPPDGGVIGFVGKEWQRKGLRDAVEIVARLRRSRPRLEFRVSGPSPDEIRHLFAGWDGGYRLLGWCDRADYAAFDVLLHPARAEPYGMVISEAMAARVPVVISEVCGAAQHVTPAAGEVVSLEAGTAAWDAAIERQLTRPEPPPQFVHSWREMAREYETIYREIPETEL